MEAKIVDIRNMETLGRLIKSVFPVEKAEVSLNHTHFAIYSDESVTDKPAQVKAAHDFVKPYVAEHGNPKEEYQLSFYRDHELIDILHFNYQHAAYQITMELLEKTQTLSVQDVLGTTGDYPVFNEDFKRIGYLSAVSTPPRNADGSVADPDDMDDLDGSYGEVYADFTNPAIWQISSDQLKPHLKEILEKVREDINNNYEPTIVNVDNPEDLAFWAEQFEISETDLLKAYLQQENQLTI